MKHYIQSDLDLSKARARELRKAQAEWQTRFEARKAEYDRQKNEFSSILDSWSERIAALAREQFQSYLSTLPNLIIEVNPYSFDRVEIHFNYSTNDGPTTALRWDYTVKLGESGVRSSTNSWSGLQVVTPEQAEDLINSANLLKALVAFDWEPLLNEAKNTKPKYNDYITIQDPSYDANYKDPGYKSLIADAERSEALGQVIGKPYWIRVRDYRPSMNSAYNLAHNQPLEHWIKIVSETPKFYMIQDGAWWNRILSHEEVPTERVAKDNIFPVEPIEMLTDEEFIDELTNDHS